MNKFMKYPVSKTRGRVFLLVVGMFLLCGIAGVVKVGPPLYRFAARRIQLHRARSQWEDVLAGAEISADAPFCCLKVPDVGLDLPVLEYSDKEHLSRLPCMSGASPDKLRSPVIVAHRDLHFRPLEAVKEGDRVYLTRRSGEQVEYRVLRLHVVDPKVAQLLAEAAQPGTLMLVTCYPFRYIGPAPERFVVVCVRC